MGGGMKFNCIGNTLAARAFELMLTSTKARDHQPSGPHSMLGHWSGDSVAILGDDTEPDWERIKREFADIEASVILLVFEVDGFERLGEAAATDDTLFMELCHLVVTKQAPALAYSLQDRFGPKFLNRYGQLCQEMPWFRPKDLVVVDHLNG